MSNRGAWSALTLGMLMVLGGLGGSSRLHAQVSTASLTGLVTDPSDAVVAGAQVSIRNEATGIRQTTTTNETGYYSLPSVAVGNYVVSVERQGFKTAVRRNVALEIGQKARMDIKMELGNVAESVTVSATSAALATQEAAPGAVIENRLVSTLPMSLRNWDDLLLLVAGVQGDRYTEQAGGSASGRTGAMNVHGVRSLQNNFILDGVDNNSISTNIQELTTQVVRPSVDAIQEFKVITNPYSAEYGRSPGAAITVTTKGGSNTLHGGLSEYLRNRVFDANDFFLNRVGTAKPAQVQNQFGGQIGGRILRDRLFFFANYEGTRVRKGVARLTSVPLANERRGDYSAAAAAANRVTYASVIDPLTAKAFPGNVIPADRFDAVSRRIMDIVPAGNVFPTTGAANLNNFVRTPSLVDDNDSFLARMDWQVNASNSVFVRYAESLRERFTPGYFGGIIDGTSTSAWGRVNSDSYGAVIGWNATLSPRMISEFRLGWGRNAARGAQEPYGKNTLSDFGIKGIPDDPLYNGGLPTLRIRAGGGVQAPGGPAVLGSPSFMPRWQYTNQYQWTDTITLIQGGHTWKFGGDLRAPMRNIFLDIPAMRGDLTFSGQYAGNSLADFQLGYISQAQTSVFAQVDQRRWMLSSFIQDDWKVTPRLTINLGLRYDFGTPPLEGANRMANLNVTTGGLIYAKAGSLAERSLVRPDKNNFAPRIGIAYQADQKTVIRTGYGRFYLLLDRVGNGDQLALNPPYLINVNTATSSKTTPIFFFRDGFPASFRDAQKVDMTRIQLRAVPSDPVAPTVEQWNFGVQRMLPGGLVATADYVGTKSNHLSGPRDINQPVLGSTTKPYPALGAILYVEDSFSSAYHGGELTVEKRFASGLSLRSAYTYSKSIDSVLEGNASGGSNTFGQDSRNLRAQRGLSDFDSRHRIVMSSFYELPFGKGKRYVTSGPAAYLAGGWQVSGIFTRRTGRPFTVYAASNNTLIGTLNSALPDRISNGSLPSSERNIDRWFDVSAFVVPTPVRYGNSGRNILTGPPLTNVDIAVSRSFTLGEQRKVEFRWESFNLSNTPQFSLPARDASARTSAGRITTLAGDSRVMQFALKFLF